MKIAIHHFSPLVRLKGKFISDSLIAKGVDVLPWKELRSADAAIVFNIHQFVKEPMQEALKNKKPIISLQEGMFAIGWNKTVKGMQKECNNATLHNVLQVVWSKFEKANYIKLGRKAEMVQAIGNPEHDALFYDLKTTRESLGIPTDAFVISHIEQYAHPRGGPNAEQLADMDSQIRRLTKIGGKVWCIKCTHPKFAKRQRPQSMPRSIIRPFQYPIFDVIRISDLVITLSSTEGLTAAILDKPLIEYDTSNSPSRWPFVTHGVAKRATTYEELLELTLLTMSGKFHLAKHEDYNKAYRVDGQSANRVADLIMGHINASR